MDGGALGDTDGGAEILRRIPTIFDHLGAIERARAEPVVRRLLGDPALRARIAMLVHAAAPERERAGLTATAVFEALAGILEAGLRSDTPPDPQQDPASAGEAAPGPIGEDGIAPAKTGSDIDRS
jgi:hypothetical protein